MFDLNRFTTLTFDCYGTLIDWEAGILAAMRPILAAHERNIDDPALLKLYGDFEQCAEDGEFQTYRDVLQSVVRQFGAELGFAPSDVEVRSLASSLGTWQAWPDTVPTLEKLKENFALAIISNVDDDLFAATRPKLRVEFDQVITAQQARAYKPSLEIFELAFSRLKTPREKILHIGQSIFHDVVPAKKLGLASVWVNRPSLREGLGAVKAAIGTPDLTISSLAELIT